MPSISKSACRCGGTRTDGVCDRCGAKRHHQLTKKQRGYGQGWETVSKRFRTRFPLCQLCESRGIVRAADHVHHKIPVRKAPHLRLDETNLMSVCKACHTEIEDA